MLTFNLKYKFYDMIKKHEKTHEYRPANRFWNSRISRLKKEEKIKFNRGYTKTHMIAVVTNIEFVERDQLPAYAQEFFKPYLKYFHDIEFYVLENTRRK